MEKHTHSFYYTSYERTEDLQTEDANLLKMAKEAATRAYAPYSQFNVGSALLLENGEIITGNNQENAAYPSGICAERVAMFYAGSRFPGIKPVKMAITAFSSAHPVNVPVPPCGSCRQVLSEYEKLYEKGIELILQGETGKIYVLQNVSLLLPLAFTADNLNA